MFEKFHEKQKRESFTIVQPRRAREEKHEVDNNVRLGDILDASKRSARVRKYRQNPRAEKSNEQFSYRC